MRRRSTPQSGCGNASLFDMRLDLYLKRCCLTRRRSEAKRACENGIVMLDGRRAKPGQAVVPGRRVSISFLDRYLELEILKLPAGNVSRTEARTYYEVLRDEVREVTDF